MRLLPIVRPISSAVVYRGPSALDGADGAPIVAILTGLAQPSKNEKTGPMAQLWIVAEDEHPSAAQRSGADRAVCGDCPLRPALQPDPQLRCYVNTVFGPGSAWKVHKDAPVNLPAALAALQGRALRLGAYGDPAAIPEGSGVVQALCVAAGTWTGYTHQWRSHAWLRHYCMASVESEQDAWCAWAEGWRTYRIADRERTLPRIEVACPYPRVQCVDCGLCVGASRQARSITIAAH